MFKKILSLSNSELFKTSGIYTITRVFEKAIPFLLLPILTRYLTTEDYGIISMFTVMVGITIPLTGLGIKPAVLRSYYKDDIDFASYLSNALFILTISSSIVLVLYISLSDIISKYAKFPSDWISAIVVASAGQFVINIILVVWQAKVKPLKYGVFKILMTFLNVGLSVFLIVALGYGWEGRVIGQIVAIVVFSIVSLYLLWQNNLIKFQIHPNYIKHALLYGVPLIPHIFSTFLITMIDRIFITNMVGISETGIYTVGYQMGMIIGILAESFNKAWTPWLWQRLKEGRLKIKEKIVKFTYAYFVIIFMLAVGLSLIAPWFMSFFVGKEFYGSVQFIFWIAIGYSFKGMYFMVTNYILYEEKTRILSLMTFMAAGINIVLNYFLINMFGAIGAAQATTITYLIQFIFTWFLASKVYNMPWLLKKKSVGR